jgi:hypothetical protein
MTYPQCRERAEAVLGDAEQRLRTETWIPDQVERRIAAELTQVLGPIAELPYSAMPLWQRLARGRAHVAALRLAGLAGGWDPSAPQASPEVSGLGDVLAALTGVAGCVERWYDRHAALARGSMIADAGDTALLTEVPELLDHLADAERFLDGYGVASTLVVIATGDVHW